MDRSKKNKNENKAEIPNSDRCGLFFTFLDFATFELLKHLIGAEDSYSIIGLEAVLFVQTLALYKSLTYILMNSLASL